MHRIKPARQQHKTIIKHLDSGTLEEINTWFLLSRTLADAACLLPNICLPFFPAYLTLVSYEVAMDPVPGKILIFSAFLTTRNGHVTSFWSMRPKWNMMGPLARPLLWKLKKGLLAWNADTITGATVAVLLPWGNDRKRTKTFPWRCWAPEPH